jgi:hypothetical protein
MQQDAAARRATTRRHRGRDLQPARPQASYGIAPNTLPSGSAKNISVVAPPPETHEVACTTCGGPLDVVLGARRGVCEHCGRLIDVIGR